MSTLSELVYYCNEANSFGALMLTGKWGCGKTYLIDNTLPKALGEECIIIRVSLFGETSIQGVNQKVQKEYFQKVILNIGSYAEPVSTMVKKINNSKFGATMRFVGELTKGIPAVDKILSLNPSEYVPIENTIGDKKVILVFDDLERSNINEVDILGCINEYCENKKIKTIVVANEDKINGCEGEDKRSEASETDDSKAEDKVVSIATPKITYPEIKEKIITRTVKYIPDFLEIISQIVDEFEDDTEYKAFLIAHKTDLVRVFNAGKSDNIRSVKCAIQDFRRVFDELIKKDYDDNEIAKYYQAFVAYMLHYKTGRVTKSERYDYLLSNYEIEKTYPGFFKSSYMFVGVQQWVHEGEWDESAISKEIEHKIASRKATAPIDLVRNSDLITLDEDIINVGFPDVVSLAYAGRLSLDEYIYFIKNTMWARSISYTLPVAIDFHKLEVGVRKRLDALCASDDQDSGARSMILPDDIKKLTDEERHIYELISGFRDRNIQMFAINKRKYLTALTSDANGDLYDCENKRYNVFDSEMANAVANYYCRLNNADRFDFHGLFRKTWEGKCYSPDLIIEPSVLGIVELQQLLRENKSRESADGLYLKAALSEMFIQVVDKIAAKLKTAV